MERELIELLKRHRELVIESNQFSMSKYYYKDHYYSIKKGYLYEEMISYIEKGKLLYQSNKEPIEIIQEEYTLLNEIMDLLCDKLNDKNFVLQKDKYERKTNQLRKLKDTEGLKKLENHYSITLSYKNELEHYVEKFKEECDFNLKNIQTDWDSFRKEKIHKYEIMKQAFLIQFEEIKETYETYRKMNASKETLQEEKESLEKRISELEKLPHNHRFYIKHCYPDQHGRLIVRECLICKKEETDAEYGKDLPPIKTYSKKDRARLLEQALEEEKTLKISKKRG